MEKTNNLDRAKKIREELEQYNMILDEQWKAFEERKAKQKEHFERMQEIERIQYERKHSEIRNFKDELLLQEKEFLNHSFFIRSGDFKNELMNHFGIEEKDIKLLIIPIDSIQGKYSTEERISMVKANSKYNRIVSVEISIPKLNIYYNMVYSMNYNMLQADGISFIDHCFSKNEWDELDNTGFLNMLRVNPDNFDDILIKIPYKTLILEAKKRILCCRRNK